MKRNLYFRGFREHLSLFSCLQAERPLRMQAAGNRRGAHLQLLPIPSAATRIHFFLLLLIMVKYYYQ